MAAAVTATATATAMAAAVLGSFSGLKVVTKVALGVERQRALHDGKEGPSPRAPLPSRNKENQPRFPLFVVAAVA